MVMGNRSITNRVRGWGGCWLQRGVRKLFRVMEMFYILILVEVIQLYRNSKIHQTVHFK